MWCEKPGSLPRNWKGRHPANGIEGKNVTLVTEWPPLTPCGPGAGGVGRRLPSHGASLCGDAMVSESVRALGGISTSRKQGRI